MDNAQILLGQVFSGNVDTKYTLTNDWGQGRAGFGGIIAGMMIAAMRRDVPENKVLLSFSCNFAGPVLLDTPFSIQTSVIRTGKNTIQMQATVVQPDEDGNTSPTLLNATFGVLRSSKAIMDAQTMPVFKKRTDYPAVSFILKTTPNFLQHIDMHWAVGGVPYTGNGGRELGGYWRWKDLDNIPLDPILSEAHYVSLIDAWPPAILPLINAVAPASTMTWTVHFTQAIPIFSNQWLFYLAQIDHSRHGYGQTHAHIWDESGKLIAVSNQLVAVFD